MVTIEVRSCFAVAARMLKYLPIEMRSTSIDASEAIKQAVPEADRKLNVYSAGYGPAVFTTGGMRSMALWRPGHGNLTVVAPRKLLTESSATAMNPRAVG